MKRSSLCPIALFALVASSSAIGSVISIARAPGSVTNPLNVLTTTGAGGTAAAGRGHGFVRGRLKRRHALPTASFF